MTQEPFVRLRASCLASKWGFEDGDVIDLFIEDNWPDFQSEIHSHVYLVALIRERLLPLLPRVEVEEIATIHNPMRATEKWANYCAFSDVYVDVPASAVWDVIQREQDQ